MHDYLEALTFIPPTFPLRWLITFPVRIVIILASLGIIWNSNRSSLVVECRGQVCDSRLFKLSPCDQMEEIDIRWLGIIFISYQHFAFIRGSQCLRNVLPPELRRVPMNFITFPATIFKFKEFKLNFVGWKHNFTIRISFSKIMTERAMLRTYFSKSLGLVNRTFKDFFLLSS